MPSRQRQRAMQARQALFRSEAFGDDLPKVLPIIGGR